MVSWAAWGVKAQLVSFNFGSSELHRRWEDARKMFF